MLPLYDPQVHGVCMLKPGKQGVVGIVYDKNTLTAYSVFKIACMFGHIATHEHSTFAALDAIHTYCPFFVRGKGYVPEMKINSDITETDNPFRVDDRPVLMDVVFMEYISNAKKLVQFVRHAPIHDSVLASQVLLCLAATRTAFRLCRFTHYDLHSENILVQRCGAPTDVFVYRDSNAGRTFLIPTHGFVPRIIDYGFAYADTMTTLMSPLAFMNNGYTSHRPDPYADFRILLVSFLDDCRRSRPNNALTDILDTLVHKLFDGQLLDYESGWFVNDKRSCCEFVRHHMQALTSVSPTFCENDLFIYDYFQTMISIPVTDTAYTDRSTESVLDELHMGIKAILKEFRVIERDFANDTTICTYILRRMLQHAQAVRSQYFAAHDPDTETGETGEAAAVRTFKNAVFDTIKPLKPFYDAKINYAKLLVAIYTCAETIQSLLTREVRYREKFIDNENTKFGLTPDEIFLVVHTHLMPPQQTFAAGNRLIYMDETARCMRTHVLTDCNAEALNKVVAQSKQHRLAAQADAALRLVIDAAHAKSPPTYTLDPVNKPVENTDSDWTESCATSEDGDDMSTPSTCYSWNTARVECKTPLRRRLDECMHFT
jgi:hypothetical protein